MAVSTKPVLLSTVFSDYICPFCYIGDLRLDRLREYYDLKINWVYEEGDDDILERGEYYASILDLRINFIEIE